MKLLKKIFFKTLLGKYIDTFYWGIQYMKDYSKISDTLYGEDFRKILNRYLNTNFRKDWIGRLYAIVNPNIDTNGKLNFNNMVIELDDNNTNNDDYVKSFIYRQLLMVSDLFKLEKLYSYITMSMEHVGPLSQDNFLVIFDVASRKEFARLLKHSLIRTIIYAVITLIICSL